MGRWARQSRGSLEALNDFFPNATLKFDGANMDLAPLNYLLLISDTGGNVFACFSWRTADGATIPTILGDIVLRDRLIIYDITNERLGWTVKELNCSAASVILSGSAVNVVAPGPPGTPASSSTLSPPQTSAATTPASLSPPSISGSFSPPLFSLLAPPMSFLSPSASYSPHPPPPPPVLPSDSTLSDSPLPPQRTPSPARPPSPPSPLVPPSLPLPPSPPGTLLETSSPPRSSTGTLRPTMCLNVFVWLIIVFSYWAFPFLV
eukprot:TRINITY_DN16955_c0_g4_i1.p1 TRINITY_DN16955_c0_g4~~TRINITY_DN16955_c0_g4_i1.p1  ORF type:complete len:263 (-),score=17.12 TRINITY_DN16955_c0_g4_i1:375-1163(-)